MKILNSYMIN